MKIGFITKENETELLISSHDDCYKRISETGEHCGFKSCFFAHKIKGKYTKEELHKISGELLSLIGSL